jgi:phosphatidylinositol glycan class O
VTATSSFNKVPPFVIAVLWKLVSRHTFFATNHGCSFSRLQYSAAFVATKEFSFFSGGISLFLNTFGWELVGLAIAFLLSRKQRSNSIWKMYTFLQFLEALTSCISVSLLRRHLMVWDIYAPHFLFCAIFTVLTGLSQITITLVSSII